MAEQAKENKKVRMNRLTTALLALIVLPVFAVGQEIRIEPEPGSPEYVAAANRNQAPPIIPVPAPETTDNQAREGLREMDGRVRSAEERANSARTEAGRANAAASRANEAVNNLVGKYRGLRKETQGLSRKVGELVKKTDSIYQQLAGDDGKIGTNDDRLVLISEKADQAYLHIAGADGQIGTNDDTQVLIKDTADAAFDALAGKDGLIGTSDDILKQLSQQITGAASQVWLWLVGLIALVSLVLHVFDFRKKKSPLALPLTAAVPDPVLSAVVTTPVTPASVVTKTETVPGSGLKITGLSPTAGPAGTPISVTGLNLPTKVGDINSISIGGVTVDLATISLTPTEIKFVAPPSPPGTEGEIFIQMMAGLVSRSTNKFTYTK